MHSLRYISFLSLFCFMEMASSMENQTPTYDPSKVFNFSSVYSQFSEELEREGLKELAYTQTSSAQQQYNEWQKEKLKTDIFGCCGLISLQKLSSIGNCFKGAWQNVKNKAAALKEKYQIDDRVKQKFSNFTQTAATLKEKCRKRPQSSFQYESISLEESNPQEIEIIFKKEELLPLEKPENKDRAALDYAILEHFYKEKYQAKTRPLKQGIYGLLVDVFVFGVVPNLTDIGAFGSSTANLILLYELGELTKQARQAVESILFPSDDPLVRFEVEYALRKRFLPEPLCRMIEEHLSNAQASSMNLNAAKDFLARALNMPRHHQKIEDSVIQETLENLSKHFENYDFETLFKGKGILIGGNPLIQGPEALRTIREKYFECSFKKEIKPDLPKEEIVIGYESFSLNPNQIACMRPLSAAIYEHIKDSQNPNPQRVLTRKFMYLHGEASTGKTYLANKIAEWLGVPIVKVTVPTTITELVGSKEQSGVLLKALTDPDMKGIDNPVLFLDEGDNFFKDPMMVGQLKSILDPTNPGYDDAHLGIKVPLNKPLILIAANSKIAIDEALDPTGSEESGEKEGEGAMASRVSYFKIPSHTPEAKKKNLEREICEGFRSILLSNG